MLPFAHIMLVSLFCAGSTAIHAQVQADGAPGRGAAQKGVVSRLALRDPLRPDLPAKEYAVSLSLDERGFPKEYRLFLQTDIGMERMSRRLEVTLFWDALGNYSRLEPSKSKPLTKSDHKVFRQEDYDRLDAILKDRESLLGKETLSFFVRPPDKKKGGADAVTTATPRAAQAAVVPGAAYTAWALWRWANGEIVGKLLDLTRPLLSSEYVKHCLLSDDPRFVEFALRHLPEGAANVPQLREELFRILEKGGWVNSELALQHLTKRPPDPEACEQRLIDLIGVNSGSSRLILGSFEARADAAPALWAKVAARLEHLRAYQDVHATLTLLEKRARDVEPVRQNVARLLKSDDPFIVRRAKEFLER